MKNSVVTLAMLCLAILLSAPQAGLAQSFPTRPIKLIVPFPPGGGINLVARIIGDRLAARLGQAVLVEQRPGAASIIGAEAVARAEPDGHTLLITGSSTFSVVPALKKELPYDPLKSFALLAVVARAPLVMVAGNHVAVRNLGDLIALARTRPGTLTYATFGAGSAPHLIGEMFAHEAGVQWMPVPYKGSGPVALALLSGEVDTAFDTAAATAPQIRAGKMKALAVVGDQRSSALPDVPTLAELKLPQATFDAWFGIAAPAATPPAVLQLLTRELAAIMSVQDVKDRFRENALDAVYIGPEPFKAKIIAEIAAYSAIARRANISMD